MHSTLAVIFIGERKPLLSACPSRPPSRVDHEVRHKPGLEAASLGSPAADFVAIRTTPRPSSTCFFAVALGDEERGVGACASHPSPAHLTCDLPDVSYGPWVLCRRRPPSADGYNNSKASMTFLLEMRSQGTRWLFSARETALWRARSLLGGGRYRAGARSCDWHATWAQVDLFFFHIVLHMRTLELLRPSTRAHASRVLFLSGQAAQALPFSRGARVRV